jgi:uncharacterized cupredoxin-like copper-binding protein
MMRRRPVIVGLLVVAVSVLVASLAIAAGLIGGPKSAPTTVSVAARPSASEAPAPATPGAGKPSKTVVNISLTDSGGPRGVGTGELRPHLMGLKLDRATVPHGAVSFQVANAGVVPHEMVILPLGQSQVVGARPFDAKAKVDEAGSKGEEEMAPGASHLLTVTLAPGQYELVCNIAGHYVSGMYGKLTVT